MSLYANTSRQTTSLEFVRALVRIVSADQKNLSPELQCYVFNVARDAANVVKDKKRLADLRPEVVEMAFEIADEKELVNELSGLTSAKAFDASVAQRLLDGLQRFAAA